MNELPAFFLPWVPPYLFVTLAIIFCLSFFITLFLVHVMKIKILDFWEFLFQLFGCSLVSDWILLGVLLITYYNFGFTISLYDNFIIPLGNYPMNRLLSCIYMVILFFLAALINYCFQRFFTFREIKLKKYKKELVCIFIALLMIPYFSFLPRSTYERKENEREIATYETSVNTLTQ